MNIQFLAEGDNLVFAGKEGIETVSSLYLAPFVTNMGDQVCCIRNVYTKAEFRRKGCMDQLLKEAFLCMQAEKDPYTFLRPYNEKYFLPYGFVDIADRPYFSVKEDSEAEQKSVAEAGFLETADFLLKEMREKADCFPLYTKEWVESMQNILKAKGGDFVAVCKDGEIIGVYSYVSNYVPKKDDPSSFDCEKVVEFAFPADRLTKEGALEITPNRLTHVMARIIDVKEMISKLEAPKEFVLAIKIFDERIPENAGLYLLHCGPKGGNLAAVKIGDTSLKNAAGEKLSAECEITIENLTRFCFGYKDAKDCFKVYVKSKEEEILGNLDNLERIRKPEFLC